MAKQASTKSAVTNQDYREQQLASIWNFKFKDAMVSKSPYTKKWQTYLDAYNGDYFKNESLPEYKSNLVSNYIFSVIETIRPIMLDQNPKFQSMPRQPEGLPFSNDLQEALTFEWDRECMTPKLYRELITMLTIGSTVWFLPWDSQKKNVRAISVNPFNIFPDPLATCVQDAEYIIYASYKNVEVLRRLFPDKSERLNGGQINYSELVQDNNKNARIDNQVLVLEVWTRDYENEESIQGNVKTSKPKYPNGRVITLCPELGIVLSDKANPYNDQRFPFIVMKDYDVPGKFWGEGEVSQLLSPQKHMNELNNAIIDNAKSSANMPWIIDKNAGIGVGKITNRPGLIIRKNPGAEVRREQPPAMPAYVVNAIETYKNDIEQISGIFDSLKGNSETGVYTAQGILALQEAGQARIRLKVKLMENTLGELAQMWFSRMQQFWKDDRWVQLVHPDGSYDLRKFTKDKLSYDYDIKITAGSTMPVNRGAMLDLMVRLAQTQMPDGQSLVDREAVVNYLPDEVKTTILRRMGNKQLQVEQQIQQFEQQMKQLQQQLQQFEQQNKQQDDQTMQTVEQIASTLEGLNKQILQVKDNNARMIEEQQRKDHEKQMQDKAYNSGYGDAQKLYDTPPDAQQAGQDAGQGIGQIPEDILQGVESLSNDQLQLLMQQHPELLELFKNQQ